MATSNLIMGDSSDLCFQDPLFEFGRLCYKQKGSWDNLSIAMENQQGDSGS